MQSKAVQRWQDTRTHRDANNFRAVLTDVVAVVLVQAIPFVFLLLHYPWAARNLWRCSHHSGWSRGEGDEWWYIAMTTEAVAGGVEGGCWRKDLKQ
jgi:hypothetical protein